MIAWCPGLIQPNTTTNHISAFWDFLPTACEIADVEIPNDIDGISYLPTLCGRKQPAHEYLYWEFDLKGVFSRALRIGNEKFIQIGIDSPIEMYNLKNDIGEVRNIADQHPDRIQRIQEMLKTIRTESDIWKMPISTGTL